jgi:PAS domain S-box-containing protein
LARRPPDEPAADCVEQRYFDPFDGAPIGLIYLDVGGRVVRANRRAAVIFGCTPTELAGRPISDFYPDLPSGRPRAMSLRHLWQAGEDVTDFEYQIRRADGQVRWIRVSVSPIVSPSRGVTAALNAVADVTEERATAEALRDAKEYAEDLLRTSNAMIVGLGPDGEITVFNDTAVEISGYTREELVGRSWFETLVPRERYPEVWEEFERLLAGGIPLAFENPILTKSGEERYVLWRNTELRRKGQVVGTLSFGIDITERRRAEEALESRNRLLAEAQSRLEGLVQERNRFIATVSHELRTPLAGVLGFAAELRDRVATFTGAEIAEFAGLIAEGCASAGNLVQDLLTAVRIEAREIAVHPEAIDLRREALTVAGEREVAAQLEARQVGERGETAIAWADRNRVHQIVRNLLLNASRYGGRHLEAVTGTRADPPAAFLQITDDGPGVPERLRESLFEPYQHGSADSGLTEPIGLGLYVSRTLARLMGGDLAYRREGGITIFELTLPPPTGSQAKAPGRRPPVVPRHRDAPLRRVPQGSAPREEGSAGGGRQAVTRSPDPA